MPQGRLDGLRLIATDADRHGDAGTTGSPELRGRAEALAMAVTGREVALEDLAGGGVDVLRRGLRGT